MIADLRRQAPTITTASRAEFVGHAFEAAIRSVEKDLLWYRRNRWLGWHEHERDAAIHLRALYRIRREAIRQHDAMEDQVRRAWAEAVERARFDPSDGHSVDPIPDVPLALRDAGDHFAGMPL